MSPDSEIVNTDANEGLPATTSTAEPSTASQKIANTLRELSKPDEDAGEMELTLATVCMALERNIGQALEEKQLSGELDVFVLQLTRFLALHRSDDAKSLIVLELPARELPAGTRLHLLDLAIEESKNVPNPLQ